MAITFDWYENPTPADKEDEKRPFIRVYGLTEHWTRKTYALTFKCGHH